MAGKPTNYFRANRKAGRLPYLQVFMSPAVKARLVDEAKAAGVSQSRFVEDLLEERFRIESLMRGATVTVE